MNIMLVSVTERTREIGLRKAVGAKTIDILGQFMMEAIILTLTGGVLGIGLGVLVGQLIEPAVGFTPIVTSGSIALAVGVSSLVGLLFGVYPAAKAARLNPIDALRYE
jgi:putative ABC transport system permease protein